MRRLPSSSGFARPAAMASRAVIAFSGSGLSILDRAAVGWTFGTFTAAALAIFVGSAARVIPTLLVVPIQRSLNWPELDITGPIAVSVAVSALGAPLAAMGLARVGVRSLIFASLFVLSGSLALSSLATSPWHLLLFLGVGVGLSGSLSASILGAIIGCRDNTSHCGASFGLFTAAQFLGSAAGLLLASRAAEVLDWRCVLSAAAAATLVAAVVLALVLQARDGLTLPKTLAVDCRSSPGAAAKKPIWTFAAIFFICGASTAGLIDSRLGILCMSSGLGLSDSADVLVIVAASGGIGSVVSGLLADRYSPRNLLILYFAARAVALLWLPFTSLSLVELAQFGAFFGLDAALTFPALVKLLSRNLGQQAIAMIVSWMIMAHTMGAAITSASVGFLGTADYAVAFTVVGFMCLLAAGLVRMSGK